MEKLIKNAHLFLIVFALFNIGMLYKETDDKVTEIVTRQEAQKTTLQKSRKTKKEIASFYNDIAEAKNKIERVAREIEKSQQLLPSEISDTDNIGLLRKMAEDVNIKEVSIMPEHDDDRGFYIARKYRFRAKATYLQFLIMFEKIAENKRILNISEMAFKKLEQPQRSKFQLISGDFILEAYRYNSGFKEERGIEKIENEFKDAAKKPGRPAKVQKAKSEQ